MSDRDELLRQIGERVVERVDEEGYTGAMPPDTCPACAQGPHLSDCPIAQHLEATDGG